MDTQARFLKPEPELRSQYRRFIALAIVVSLAAVGLASGGPILQKGGTLTGNWLVTVTRIDPPPGLPPTFLSLQTYFAEDLFLEESNTNLIRSSARGMWDTTGLRQFRRSFLFFRFDASRNFIGTARNRATITLSEDGQRFRADAILELFDADGTPLSTSRAIEMGQRQTEAGQRQ
jgi:hypothetical protein